MEHDEDLVERPSGHFAGFLRSRCFLIAKNRLNQLQIPIAKLAPRKLIDRVRCCIKAQIGHRFVERFTGLLNLADDPLVDRQLGCGRFQSGGRADFIGLAIARCIPQLGREIAISFDPLVIHLDVAALAFHRGHEEAQGISAILIDEAQWIDDIAFGFGHFRAIGRAHEAVEIEARPRGLTHIILPHHHHPRIPEEEDVKA